MNEQFKKDVLAGLSSSPKFLSSKYFYDEIGDELFVQIMNMPEYYLTNSEFEIFSTKSNELINAFDVNKNEVFELIELGAGDGTKTKELLKELINSKYYFKYVPIDISEHALDKLECTLAKELPDLEVEKQQGDYFGVLSSLKERKAKKVVLFLGSNIGNLTDDLSANFLNQLNNSLNQNDVLLLGVDLIKPVEVVLPAYNDAAGITAKFNLNLLHRMNKELGANFNVNQFKHDPYYTEEEGIAKSYLTSKIDQIVELKDINKQFEFKAGEKIHTEISRKYNDEIISNILKETSFNVKTRITDSKEYFADYVLIKG